MKQIKILLPWVLLSATLPGCGTISFYWQAFNGQWELSRRSKSIETVIGDSRTPEDLRERLKHVQKIRAFAIAVLALPDNRSYRQYADLKRRFVLWNVFATAEFSMQPKEWCFPIAGCVGYRGYFHEEAARAFAGQLREQGYDVFVGGVRAYSTLGYLDDPVVSQFSFTPIYGMIFHYDSRYFMRESDHGDQLQGGPFSAGHHSTFHRI